MCVHVFTYMHVQVYICVCIRAERLITFAIISRYDKTRFSNRKGCDLIGHMTCE